MSQKAVFVRLNGGTYPEVFSSIPDEEEVIHLCKEYGYEQNDEMYAGDYIIAEYEWIDIGSGESDTDTFYDDETLLYMYDSDMFEELLEKDGHSIECVESGEYEILYSELGY